MLEQVLGRRQGWVLARRLELVLACMLGQVLEHKKA
jgi:hypothetical protein